MRCTCSLVVALAALASETMARAAVPSSETPADPGNVDADYRREVREGVAAFEVGRWADSRAAFERAHVLRPSARTFRGIGVAAFAGGDYAAAVVALEHALIDERAPLTPEQHTEAEALLEQARQHTVRVAPSETKVEPALAPPPLVLPSSPSSPSSRSSHPVTAGRVAGFVVLGLAPLAATAAAVIWETGKNERDSIASACNAAGGCTSDQIAARSSAASLQAHETWTDVSLAAAGASAAAGLVLLLISGGPSTGDRVAVGPGSLRIRF